jgi:DNA-binding transcriptional regulator GbsR (MarR family)
MANRTLDEATLQEMAKQLETLPKRINVDDAREIWGYKSKSSAWLIFEQLQELGLVRHVKEDGSEKGEWYLAESRNTK